MLNQKNLRFPSKNDVRFVYTLIFVVGGICHLYLFTYTGVQHEYHITRCSCSLTVTRRVAHVEQKLLDRPDHLSSPLL